MLKKYLPYLLLVAAGLLFYFVKKNQRGNRINKPETEQVTERITVPAILPQDEKTEEVDGFDRHATHIIFSKHAKCRMDCRNIDESEVKEILKNGTSTIKKFRMIKEVKLTRLKVLPMINNMYVLFLHQKIMAWLW